MELSGTVLPMKKLLLSYVKLGSRREVSRSRSNVMALCSRTDTANSRETYAGREVTKSCAVSNFVSADRIELVSVPDPFPIFFIRMRNKGGGGEGKGLATRHTLPRILECQQF